MSRPTLKTTLRLAARAYADEDYERARDAAATAIALDPESVPAHHYLAASLAALGQTRAADRVYHEGLALAPSDADLILGLCDLLTGELGRDAPALEEALALGELGARLAIARGDETQALEFHLVCARALTSLGRPADTLDILARYPEVQSTDLHLQRGMACFELGHFEPATLHFEAALTLEADEALAHFYLGLVADHLGDPTRAAYHQALAERLDPDTFPPPYPAAERTFERALARARRALSPTHRARLEGMPIRLERLPPRERLGPISPLALWAHEPLPGGRGLVLYRRNLERQVRDFDGLAGLIERCLRAALSDEGRSDEAETIPLFS